MGAILYHGRQFTVEPTGDPAQPYVLRGQRISYRVIRWPGSDMLLVAHGRRAIGIYRPDLRRIV